MRVNLKSYPFWITIFTIVVCLFTIVNQYIIMSDLEPTINALLYKKDATCDFNQLTEKDLTLCDEISFLSSARDRSGKYKLSYKSRIAMMDYAIWRRNYGQANDHLRLYLEEVPMRSTWAVVRLLQIADVLIQEDSLSDPSEFISSISRFISQRDEVSSWMVRILELYGPLLERIDPESTDVEMVRSRLVAMRNAIQQSGDAHPISNTN